MGTRPTERAAVASHAPGSAAFIQDTFTANRLTVSLGLRADHLTAWSPASVKRAPPPTPWPSPWCATYFQPTLRLQPLCRRQSYPAWNNAFPYGTHPVPARRPDLRPLRRRRTASEGLLLPPARRASPTPRSAILPPLSRYGYRLLLVGRQPQRQARCPRPGRRPLPGRPTGRLR